MTNRPGKTDPTSPLKRILGGIYSVALVFTFAFCNCGCQDPDFFASKPTALESQNLLRELETIKPSTDGSVYIHDAYTFPSQIIDVEIAGQKETKLIYTCRHHPVNTIIEILNIQYIKPLHDNQGNPIPGVPYTISSNPSMDQLIVGCPDSKYAKEMLVFLEQVDVPPIQIRIDCMVSEVYADHTMDWETNVEIQNLLGGEIDMKGIMPGAALRDAARRTFGMKTGLSATDTRLGDSFTALVDMLVSRGYLKILMSPHLTVINGQTASIITDEKVPLAQARSANPDTGVITYQHDFADIIDSLDITPTVYADGTIGLKTTATIGSKATPEGVTQVPIVTTRKVSISENRIRNGESLVIGGIQKTEQRSVVRGVPLLKDLPILGILFSSKDFEERGKEVLFIITPTIVPVGIPHHQMVSDLQDRHDPVRGQESFMENITDPFGSRAYTDIVEKEATDAEVRRIKAEMMQKKAEQKADMLEKKLLEASDQAAVEKAKADVAQVKTKTAQSTAEAERAKAQAAEKEKQITTQDAEKAKADAEAAKEAAEKAKKDAEAEIAEWMKKAKQKPEITPQK